VENLDKYYKKLRLKPGASKEEIQHAFRDLLRGWHPEQFRGNRRAQLLSKRKLKEIYQAYKILSSQPDSSQVISDKETSVPQQEKETYLPETTPGMSEPYSAAQGSGVTPDKDSGATISGHISETPITEKSPTEKSPRGRSPYENIQESPEKSTIIVPSSSPSGSGIQTVVHIFEVLWVGMLAFVIGVILVTILILLGLCGQHTVVGTWISSVIVVLVIRALVKKYYAFQVKK